MVPARIRWEQEFRVSFAGAGDTTIARVMQNAVPAKEPVNQGMDCPAHGAGGLDLISD